MKKRNFKSILAVAFAMVLCLGCMVGCGQTTTTTTEAVEEKEELGGVICLKVNPEIAVKYDEKGMVTELEARNDDAKKILEGYTDYEGKECKVVLSELVAAIGAAGYFVEEVDDVNSNKITLEIEKGSQLPSDTFIDDIIKEVRNCVSTNNWKSPLTIENESDYGMSDYQDTDYGTDNDGATNFGDDTDYGTGNDGVTDYADDDTDYGPNNDGVTDYADTDYGAGSDGVTDYTDTDYGAGSDGVTDYSAPAASAPATPAPAPAPAPAPTPTPAPSTGGNSGYSNYDSNSNYGGGDSGYGNS